MKDSNIFVQCFNKVVEEEGVFSGDRKYGVPLASFRGYHGNNNLKLEDLHTLTAEEAREIMLKKYWNAFNGDRIAKRSPGIALQTLDYAVQSGVKRARGCLNRIGMELSSVRIIDLMFVARLKYLSEVGTPEQVRRCQRIRNLSQLVHREHACGR